MSAATRMSAKGQVVIPKALRRARHWGVGTEFDIVETTEGLLLRPKGFAKTASLDDVAGMLAFQGKAATLAEMDLAIEAGMAERWARKSEPAS
jgi:AbrB family looped-hinge helix DNA binding protein